MIKHSQLTKQFYGVKEASAFTPFEYTTLRHKLFYSKKNLYSLDYTESIHHNKRDHYLSKDMLIKILKDHDYYIDDRKVVIIHDGNNIITDELDDDVVIKKSLVETAVMIERDQIKKLFIPFTLFNSNDNIEYLISLCKEKSVDVVRLEFNEGCEVIEYVEL